MGTNYARGLYKEYELILSKNEKLEMEHRALRIKYQLAQKEAGPVEYGWDKQWNSDQSDAPYQKEGDSEFKKKTGLPIGGQNGHPKRKLEAFAAQEVTENENHLPECICKKCGKKFRMEIAQHLKEENQYGKNVQVLALSLMNIGNVSINKTRKMIYGFNEEDINPSEGYIAKLQKRAATYLDSFLEELRCRCLVLKTVYWDDTVIAINKERACLRFYEDEKTALYKAHPKKDKIGIGEDRILSLLPKETVVMHDHNRVNYNKDYGFTNIECNIHLLRDLQKTADNFEHKWATELKELLEKTNAERNQAMEEGKEEFEDEYVKKFFEEYDRIMLKAIGESENDRSKYYGTDEQALIVRMGEYEEN